MASFDDDQDAIAGSQDEFDNEDEDMEDVNEVDQDADQDEDQGGDEEEEEDNEDNDNDNDEDEDDDQNEPESPTRRPAISEPSQKAADQQSASNPALILTSPSPRASRARTPAGILSSYLPITRPEALDARMYDIVPTIAAPQGTSINAIAATADMRWVFSGGSDGYVRMFNWIETANGKVPLTVAQKHPFVDSVMKAGSLLTYWENEEIQLRTPTKDADEGKWTSPVYSLAVQHQAVWLLSGLESGGINLQTCRHQAGTIITTLREHTSAVSVLNLAQDETSLLSGSWDKNVHDWDLQKGKVKRSFRGSGSQISAVETRPISDVSVPEITDDIPEYSTTFSTNDTKISNGMFHDGTDGKGGEEDALASPSGSLFGEGDHGSLFGEDNMGVGNNAFGEDDDALTRDLTSNLDSETLNNAKDVQSEMTSAGQGGPVQPPASTDELPAAAATVAEENINPPLGDEQPQTNGVHAVDEPLDTHMGNGLPHSDEPLTAPPSNGEKTTDLPAQSESTFLDAAIDGTLRIWDRRMANPVATIRPFGSTPPWCTGACWSPDGNFFYAGRRNCTVDEYSIHHLGSKRSEPNRVFKFQQGSGPVYAVRAMPNKKHLVCASQDILRIYDLAQSETSRHRTVPFTIVPGHRGGSISAIYIDPTCRFMLSAAGNRGWEGNGTEVLLGYEIGVQDETGTWLK